MLSLFVFFKEYYGDEAVQKLKEIKYGPLQKNYTTGKQIQSNLTGTTTTAHYNNSVPACAEGIECTS